MQSALIFGLRASQLTDNKCFMGKGGYRRSIYKKNYVKVRQILSFASNTRNPLRAHLAISSVLLIYQINCQMKGQTGYTL